MSEPVELDLRAKGNQAFRDGNFKLAHKLYSDAICKLEGGDHTLLTIEDLIVLYRNRSQCNLNLNQFAEAKADATYVLDRQPDDTKALFRRAQAAHKLDDLQRAYEDALRAYRLAPQNNEIGSLMRTVYEQLLARRVEPNASSSGKVMNMLEKLERFSSDKSSKNLDVSEHYLDFINNYHVLCRDEPDMSQLYADSALNIVCNFAQTAYQLECESAKRNAQSQAVQSAKTDSEAKDKKGTEKPKKPITQAALRCLSTLCKHDASTSIRICSQLRTTAFAMLDDAELTNSASLLLNNVLRTVSGIDEYRKAREDYEALRKAVHYQGMRPFRDFEIPAVLKQFVRDLLVTITRAVNSYKVSRVARDTIIELLTHFVPLNDYRGLNCVKMFIGLPDQHWDLQDTPAPTSEPGSTAVSQDNASKKKKDSDLQSGLHRVLDVACSCAFARKETDARLLDVSDETRSLVAVCLAKVYEGLPSDAAREHFAKVCTEFITDLLGDNDNLVSKLEALTVITVLLEGPSEVGGNELGRQGLFDMVIAMLDVPEGAYRAVALDVLIAALRKPKSSSGLIDRLVPTLKSVYKDDADEGMRVRALVGLCKLASTGGTDASVRPLADGSLTKLASSCKRFLVKPSVGSGAGDVERIKHAIEGLAYLTLDADVKEDLVNDMEAMRAIWQFAEKHPAACLFACGTVLVNVTNSYDKADSDKITPEMIELAKFAKQHVPEQHPKDSSEYVAKRVSKLIESGVASAMRALTEKASGSGPRELLSRSYLAIVTFEAHRGIVVQQGGGKALLSLAQDGSELGCTLAAQALAKLCITLNPQLALPGQRVYEVLRPLIKLLHVERSGLQNFEALLALTNIASLSTKLRDKIVKEGAYPSIENYLFEDHTLIKRAAAECICNLIQNPEVVLMYEAENDRVKMLLLSCWTDDEDDIPLVKASSGALAQLTAVSTIASLKLLQVGSWYEIFKFVLSHPAIEVQHRGIVMVQNMVTTIETEETERDPEKERVERERRTHITRTLVESNLFELVLALTKFDEDSFSGIIEEKEKEAGAKINVGLSDADLKRIRKLIQDCAKDVLECARKFGFVEKV